MRVLLVDEWEFYDDDNDKGEEFDNTSTIL